MRRGVGDKWMIRETLRRLRMPTTLIELPKRAMQFGTKSNVYHLFHLLSFFQLQN